MEEDQENSLPEFIIDFINSLYMMSKVDSKKNNWSRFNFCLFLINNENKKDFEHHFVGSTESDVDAEILLNLIWKHAIILSEKINKNPNYTISYPKPKMITNDYFGDYESQLQLVLSDLNTIYKKHNYSYCFILYQDETIKYIYKLKNNFASIHIANIDTILDHARTMLTGISIEDIISEHSMEDSDEEFAGGYDSSDDIMKKINKNKEDILDNDNDEFNNY